MRPQAIVSSKIALGFLVSFKSFWKLKEDVHIVKKASYVYQQHALLFCQMYFSSEQITSQSEFAIDDG